MSFEIDYIPVGEGERSGDAICLRFGNLVGPRAEQTIVVIDGGDKKSGEEMAAHIQEFYNTDSIDFVVSTHPDSDHASGLTVILEKFKVGTLLLHKPWEHAAEIKNAFLDGHWTARGLEEKIEKSLKNANELEAIAIKKGISIVEPFQGVATQDGSIKVLGPSKEFYEQMIPLFRSTPTARVDNGLLGGLIKRAEEAVRFIEDRMDIDILNDKEDTTSAENNTSAIVLLTLGEHRLLFTGDAGKAALLGAITYAESLNIPLTGLRFLDVPHHGSRRNLNSDILKKMNAEIAFISATGENPKHPSKRVTNALKKHGANVIVTRKQKVLHHHEANHRGWNRSISVEPFYSQVEE